MNNTLLIGKYIYKFLSENAELNNILNGNIFPLIANEEVNYPFVVYGKDNITTEYVKDMPFQDVVSLRFYIVSDNYIESLEIANKIRNILDGKTYKDEHICISQMRVDSITESFEEDAYIQTIYISAISRY